MTSAGPSPLPKDALSQKLAELDSVPLFMKELPDDTNEDSTIAALQSLAFDGTPDEVAQNFKDQGNEYFLGKRFREAVGFYAQGIDAKPEDGALMEALLCNRAACNLELKNYGSVLRDCSRAITINAKSSKAFYRSAMALFRLERYEEAVDCCERCLAFDEGNASVRELKGKSVKAKEDKDRKEAERVERVKKEQELERRMQRAFKERNIISVPKPEGSQNPYAPKFDPEDPSGDTLIVPVFFLYPQHATSDVIPEFVEDTHFGAHISIMFPPEAPSPQWDTKKQYVADRLVVYAMTKRKRLLKVGKKLTLRDVCRAAKAKEGDERDGLEMKDGCLTYVVLPKGEEENKWVDEFKSNRESGKGIESTW